MPAASSVSMAQLAAQIETRMADELTNRLNAELLSRMLQVRPGEQFRITLVNGFNIDGVQRTMSSELMNDVLKSFKDAGWQLRVTGYSLTSAGPQNIGLEVTRPAASAPIQRTAEPLRPE